MGRSGRTVAAQSCSALLGRQGPARSVCIHPEPAYAGPFRLFVRSSRWNEVALRRGVEPEALVPCQHEVAIAAPRDLSGGREGALYQVLPQRCSAFPSH